MSTFDMWTDSRYSWDGTPATPWPPPGGTIYDPTRDGPPQPYIEPGTTPTPTSTPGSPPPAAPAAPTPPTLEQLDARATINTFLTQYGLGELSDWAWQQIVAGATPNQITLQLYDRTSEPGKVVQRLYPEVFERMDKGLPPMSIGDAVTYRNSAIQLFRAAGLPTTFYDQPEDLAKFAGNDVSLTELKARVDQGVEAATNAPAEARAELARLYGVDSGQLAAYYLDPTRALPAIQQQYQAASVSGAGVRAGYGGLSQSEAERLAQLGVSADQAQQGFGQLASMGELFNPLPGEQGAGVERTSQLAAEFEGNAQAQQQIERQRRARLAVFGSGGSFASSQGNLSGLGVATGQ